jgi:hypothetical protein
MLYGRGLFLITSNHPSVLVTTLDAAVIDNAVITCHQLLVITLRVIIKRPSSPFSYHNYLSNIITWSDNKVRELATVCLPWKQNLSMV